MKVGSLFSGIGGLDLGLERAGMEIVWQCESDPYCRAVLRKHWPHIELFGDVRTLYAPRRVDLICGGFPCQPVSQAGRRRAQADDRWLWPEMARVLRDLRPRYVLVENVPGLLARGMGDVLGDLASLGFDAEWESLPVAAFGAPHLRDRVFIFGYRPPETVGRPGKQRRVLADTESGGQRPDQDNPDRSSEQNLESVSQRGSADVAYSQGERSELRPTAGERLGGSPSGRVVAHTPSAGRGPEGAELARAQKGAGTFGVPARSGWWATEPDVGRVAHGIPSRVDRLRALGNAVVPQVAEWIGRRIMAADERSSEREGR
jgi:DNA (cytosine-5)-methyltransferase 1